jgi:hypothetical protein
MLHYVDGLYDQSTLLKYNQIPCLSLGGVEGILYPPMRTIRKRVKYRPRYHLPNPQAVDYGREMF